MQPKNKNSKIEELGYLEEQILVVILILQKYNEQAFGLLVFNKFKNLYNIEVVNGTVYNTLHRLENKGLLRSETTQPISQRGGREKRVYFLEEKGLQQLKESYSQKKAQLSKLENVLQKAGILPI